MPKVSIEEHVVESFRSTLKEVRKHAKMLENHYLNWKLQLNPREWETHRRRFVDKEDNSFDDVINKQLLDGTIDRISNGSKDRLLDDTIDGISDGLKDVILDSTINQISDG